MLVSDYASTVAAGVLETASRLARDAVRGRERGFRAGELSPLLLAMCKKRLLSHLRAMPTPACTWIWLSEDSQV